MTDKPKTPEAGGDPPGPSSPLRDSVSSATARIQVIIEAAEKAAAGIIEDAEAQARRYLEESRQRADRVADERARVMTELTDSLIEQAETVKRQSEELISALDQAKLQIEDRVRNEPASMPAANPPPLAEAPAPQGEPQRSSPVPHLKPVQPPAEPEQAAGASAGGEASFASQPAESGAGSEPVRRGVVAANASGGPPSAGARLLATQMAVAGSSRDEIESRLRNEFGIQDAGPMLDAILGPER